MSLSLAGNGTVTGFDPVASGFGGLVAVKHALKTDTETFSSVAAGANVAVTGLSVTHAMASASNRLLITAFFGAAASSQQNGAVGIAVADGGTLIGIGDADGTRTRVSAGGAVAGATATTVTTMPSITFVYEPGDTTSRTYTVRAINIRQDARTLYINRNEADAANENSPRGASALVVQEVAV